MCRSVRYEYTTVTRYAPRMFWLFACDARRTAMSARGAVGATGRTAARMNSEKPVGNRTVQQLEISNQQRMHLQRLHEISSGGKRRGDLGNRWDTGPQRSKPTYTHLRENLTESIDEKDLAEMVNQSPSAFSRAFKRHTGSTLVRYKNQLRVPRPWPTCRYSEHSLVF